MKEKVSVPFMLLGILFNVCLIAANLLETKVIQVGSLTVTAGLLVFPISYIINDCIAEVWGFKKARLIIWSGFAMNFFVVGLGLIAVAIPAAPFWEPYRIQNRNALRLPRTEQPVSQQLSSQALPQRSSWQNHSR